ncbi:myotubularin-related protein 14-like isoform X2 [Ceratina calcarata]|uniref:Myotubularin-related protein 14-like isoform X2 n=1 Tax=Ceratina calcarata TaxID=156304 RepID=A0AAJ7SC59_9HYME|nr:myotubularin-related protein 14-like isoform X2 [Ceratina calcarata]
MTEVSIQDLEELLGYFSTNTTYEAKNADITCKAIMQKCLLLTDLDYTHSVINNSEGDLSASYPSHLIILKYKKFNLCDTLLPLPEIIDESMYDFNELKELINTAKYARCRTRFPLPVILYKGRHVCRSATVSGGVEMYGRSVIEYLYALFGSKGTVSVEQEVDEARGDDSVSNESSLYDKVRQQDIKLLKTFNVGTIIDFMVEKKKVKCNIKEFRGNNFLAEGLMFDWSQPYVDAEINVPEDSISSQLRINWDQYQGWDLLKLTQNYLKLILRYLSDSSNGILIHCISGWDRTPLFISLLRISLWADGAIHTSLNVYQILYYTIAYDWMLFGHDLKDRLSKGEDIFFFCFYFLKHIYNEEFSIHSLRNDSDSQLDNVTFVTSRVIPCSVSDNLNPNSSPSSVSKSSRDSLDNNPPALFHCDSTETIQDDCHGNENVVPRSSYLSPKKRVASGSLSPLSPNRTSLVASGSRSPLSPNRNSPVAFGSRSVLSPNRTSPIAIPGQQQAESLSSGGGSWQMISGTGSLHGSTTVNAPLTDGLTNSLGCKPLSETSPGHTPLESSITIIKDEACCWMTQSRREKLECLRNIFYKVYSHTVGFK